MKHIYVKYLFLLLILWSSQGWAQNASNEGVQGWTDLTLTHFYNQKLSIGGDAGIRSIFPGTEWTQVYLRPTLSYSFTPSFRMTGGIATFNTFDKEITNLNEFRSFQDIHVSWPDLGWVDFYHRFRFEQRYFYQRDIDNYWNFRGRYLIRARTNDFRLIGKQKAFYLKIMLELLASLENSSIDQIFDSQRIYFALRYRASDRFRYELFYVHQRTKELEHYGFESADSIIRLRFFYTLKLPE